ncbi:MAG: alpha/beta hydrolase [Desulfobulbaceae bacterium]
MSDLTKLDRPEILRVLFHPRREPPGKPPVGAEDINIRVADGVTVGTRFFSANLQAPTILFFHGNGETVPDYDDIGPIFTSLDINFLIADYRGYGWSDGSPSASALIRDGRTILETLSGRLKQAGYSGKLFVMGRSMGSAPAIDLAAGHADMLAGLIIESGFADTVPLARTLGIDLPAMGITEEDGFNNARRIEQVMIPTLILHGARDSLIPLWHAEKLHAACGARSKELQVIPGADHNSVMAVAGMLYFQAIKGYVDRVTGAADWRRKRRHFKKQDQLP